MIHTTVGLIRKKLLGPALWNGGGFLASSAVTIFWYWLVLKTYSGTESAALLLDISTAGVITLVDMGASLGLISVLSRSLDTKERDFGDPLYLVVSTLIAILVLEVVAGIGIIFLAERWGLISVGAVSGIAIIAFALTSQTVTTATAALKGARDFRSASVTATCTVFIVFGTGSLGMLNGVDARTVFLHMTIIQLFTAAGALIVVISRPVWKILLASTRSDAHHAHQQNVKYFFLHSIAYFPQTFAGTFFTHTQRFIVAYFLGADQVAKLAFAYSLATRVHALINAFLEVLFPFAPDLAKEGIDIRGFALRTGAGAALVFLPMAAAATALTAIVAASAAGLTAGYLVGVFFAVAVAPAFQMLNAHGKALRLSIVVLGSPMIFALIILATKQFSNVRRWDFPVAYAGSQVYVFVVVLLMLVSFGTSWTSRIRGKP